MNGTPQTTPQNAPQLVQVLHGTIGRNPTVNFGPVRVTTRQLEAGRLWCAGWSQNEIARGLGISSNSVFRRTYLLRKNLGCESIATLSLRLRHYGITLPERVDRTPPAKPRRYGPLMQAVELVATSETPVPYPVPEGQHFYDVEKWAWQYARRRGFRVRCRHKDGVVWIEKKA